MTFSFHPFKRASGVGNPFPALGHRNYRLWFVGQLVSLVGSWMQNTALAYLLYEITKSAAYLGYIGFVAGLPAWIFMIYGGVVADRFSRKKLLVATQAVMMLLSAVLAALVFADLIEPWHILAISFLTGVATSFDAPARHSFVVELVPADCLTNAIALNSAMFTAAVVAGPAAAGLVYSMFGPAWCFIVNAVSFTAILVALALIRVMKTPARATHTSALAEAREGLLYAFRQTTIRPLIMSVGMMSVFGAGMISIFPAWAVQILHGGVKTNAWLLSSRGVGALLGALAIAVLARQGLRGRLWAAGSFILPVTMAFFAATRSTGLAMFWLAASGLGIMAVMNTSNALVQSLVDPKLRGRVMSIFTLTFFGGAPIGSLFAGHVAEKFGEPAAVWASVAILLAFAVAAWFRLAFIRRLE